jgi:hypothetical protein
MATDPLSSAGRATSARALAEKRALRSGQAGFHGFLTDVKRMANARARSGQQVSLSDVMSLWEADPRLSLDSRVPEDVFVTVRSVMAEAAEGRYTAAKRTRAMAAALNPKTGTMRLGGQPAGGDNWDARHSMEVRTDTTWTFNDDRLTELGDAGFSSKRWVSHHDRITRPTHLTADGQTVPLGSEFIVGGAAMAAPGDRNGPIQETANCRCVVIGVK